MSVIGRLWRRAPTWRLLVIVAIGSTALAAMFPPHLPSLPAWRMPSGASGDPGAHYTPQPDPTPLDYSTVALPPIAETRSGMIPFAGRQVPLPAGKWSELALLRGGGPSPQQAVVLARIQSDRLTGMIVVGGSEAIRQAPATPMTQSECADPLGLGIHDISPPDTHNMVLQECWMTRKLPTSALIDPNGHNPLESRSFARLGKLDIQVPAHLLTSHYFRHDESGGLAVTILLPDPTGTDAGLMRRSESWMRNWVPLLHRGFQDALKPGDISPALARDPGASPSPS